MFATETPSSHEGGGVAVECDLVASATAAVSAAQVPHLREPILAAFSERLSNALLKQADDQSLLALAAFGDLLGRQPTYRAGPVAWGLVAAPRTPGRKRVADALPKFKEAGAWSVSPHIIPHSTLHSLSGLLSQALGLYGPNIGTGGLPGSEGEALTIAAAWLAAEDLPGVWVVLTGWERETMVDAAATCQAVVLGLAPARAAHGAFPRLIISPDDNLVARLPRFNLEGLRAALESSGPGSWRLGEVGALHLRAAPVREVAA